MKKKLALLGILKMDKPILMLDEPFNGIDMEASVIIKLLLRKLKENGKTILVSSHILETLTNTCDYILYLDGKKIKKTYSRDELSQVDSDIFKEMEEETIKLINKAI